MNSTDNFSGLRELMRKNNLEFLTAEQFDGTKPAEQEQYYARFSEVLRAELSKRSSEERTSFGLTAYRGTVLEILRMGDDPTLPPGKYTRLLEVCSCLIDLERIMVDVDRMGSDPAYREYGVRN